MALLSGFRLVQVGPGKAAAVCGRVFADAGARVVRFGERGPLPVWDRGKEAAGSLGQAVAGADLIVAEGSPEVLRRAGFDAESLRQVAGDVPLVLISPYGQSGPKAEWPASDLTLQAASGIARMATGQVDDVSEPPVRAVGDQAYVIGGLAAACAGMHAALGNSRGAVVDISMQEALATLAMTELARVGQTGKSWSRRRVADGNGATVCILPASDGYVAISPREEKQWRQWLGVIGQPAWGEEARFAKKADRVANWDALHALMSEWSREHPKRWIADQAQAAHVPSFPLGELAEQLDLPQLAHRGFWQDCGGAKVPSLSAKIALSEGAGGAKALPQGPLPLSGVRVLDFSWVIAGPTTTRHLAALGADVVKVEAPGPGDPARGSGLHEILGQAKRGVVLDLKSEHGLEHARALIQASDVVVENFATGVMDRLGLGVDAMRALNPDLVAISLSGLGRTGPEARAVAYGTLLQCYVGFAGLNRHPDRAPRVGMAWIDPMCGLLLPYLVAGALWRRKTNGGGAVIDVSMVESLLWTLAEPLARLQAEGGLVPAGNEDAGFSPHGVFPCQGEDAWLALACDSDAARDALAGLAGGSAGGLDHAAIAKWTAARPGKEAEGVLVEVGVAAAVVASSADLRECPHLAARGFWEADGQWGADGKGRVMPGLPWQASFGRQSGAAPGLGQHTDEVLAALAG